MGGLGLQGTEELGSQDEMLRVRIEELTQHPHKGSERDQGQAGFREILQFKGVR